MNTNYAVDFIGRSRKEIILLKKRIANFRGNISILNSKVVYVNYDLTINDTTSKVFKTVAEAQTWITANGGTLSVSNTWTIKLPSGIITEPLVKLEFIDFEPSAGTIINELTSAVVYNTSADFWKASICNAIINTINIPAGMCLSLFNCKNKALVIEDNTSNVYISGGLFTDLDLGNCDSDLEYVSILGEISNYNATDFYKCVFSDGDDIEVESGDILNFKDCFIPKIINSGGIVKTYNKVHDSDLTASESRKGCIRYTEGSGYSRYQMIMKTGTDTWEWVTIKENTW